MRILAFAAMLTAACSPAAPEDGTAPSFYRAGGNEPFWSVTVADGEMRLERPDFPPLQATVTASRATPDGLHYAADGLALSAAHDGCEDSMSGFAFPDTVTVIVTAGSLILEGCGGDRVPGTGNP